MAFRSPFPLRAKLVIMASCLTLVPLSVVGYLLYDVNAQAVKELSRDVQLSALDDIARTIDQEFVEAQDGLHTLGRVLSAGGPDADATIEAALALVEGREALDHASIYDAQGQLIDTIREGLAGSVAPPSPLPEELRLEAAATNVATGEVVLVDGAPRVPLVVPLRAQGRLTGFTASLVALDRVQDRVERIGATRFRALPGAVLVVDENRRILAHSDGLDGRVLSEAQEVTALAGNEELRVQLAHSTEYTAADGTQMVGSLMALQSRQWFVLVQQPRAVAYSSLIEMGRIVIATVGFAIVIALLAGFFVAGRITAPLKKLTTFAADLAARRFDRQVEVKTGDELRVLASALNGAATELMQSEEAIRQEQAIRSDLGRYLPAPLVDAIVKREQEVALGGERREVTVLFADVVAFTPLTQKHPPEEVVAILNELFTILTEIVFRHGGTVDKFVGDCVMALWGAPTEQEDHAKRAVAAAEDMLGWLETGNAAWQERYDVTVRLAIGIHSGEAVVGNIGSETRMEYTAIGDVVNMAARLEAMARPQQILVTEKTKNKAGDEFDYLPAGSHHLAGREEAAELFEVSW